MTRDMHHVPLPDDSPGTDRTPRIGAESGSDTVPNATTHSDRRVERASVESFPASDPPAFTRTRAGGGARAKLADSGQHFAALHASEWTEQWVASLIDALDAHDAETVGALLTDDAIMRWGDAPPAVGRQAAVAYLLQWFAGQPPADRHILDVRGDNEAVFIEIDVRGPADREIESTPEAISARLRAGGASRLTRYGGPP